MIALPPRFVRSVWISLTSLTAWMAIMAVRAPMSTVTTCELGVFPTRGVGSWAECNGSIGGFFGWWLVGVLVLPAVGVGFVAFRFKPRLAAMAATGLSLLAVGGVLNAIAFGPILVSTLGFFLPAALLAILAAVGIRVKEQA